LTAFFAAGFEVTAFFDVTFFTGLAAFFAAGFEVTAFFDVTFFTGLGERAGDFLTADFLGGIFNHRLIIFEILLIVQFFYFLNES
jgi:hypothetical protein